MYLILCKVCFVNAELHVGRPEVGTGFAELARETGHLKKPVNATGLACRHKSKVATIISVARKRFFDNDVANLGNTLMSIFKQA